MRSYPRSSQFVSVWCRFAVGSATAAAVLAVLALPARGAPPSIREKQHEAEAIIGQLAVLDSELNRAVEAYNGAQFQLRRTEQAINVNTRKLGVAKGNLRLAQRNIAARLVAPEVSTALA